ncbi:hypothetical protein CJD36_012525 [Flavipsychrobacter stenotrophus]|uniref:Uncharacterized protein n=1 Tax=Flavipsychrobacter stenotrophus TaxID=2077091 RepID=A0A2S7SVQ3_9BACT|nr:hypothetical protein [Flavipsychrobacter stenotrophus]PQJ10788.1 hypothetical protein CJD36_012525 [Flavipsychrobacter stenotrophus]
MTQNDITRKTEEQILIDTNTDDAIIAELLEEDADPTTKLPYSKAFIKKHKLAKAIHNVTGKLLY